MARLLKSSGEIQEVNPGALGTLSLVELQTLVGGGIETVELCTGSIMVINEDHAKGELAYNENATLIYIAGTGCPDGIHGDALICEKGEVE